MGMPAQHVHRIAVQEREQLFRMFDPDIPQPLLDGTVLGNQDMRSFRNIGQKALHKVQGFPGIAFCVIVGRLGRFLMAAGDELDIVQSDDKVVPQEKGIIIGAESRLIGSARRNPGLVLDKVMVADYGVERNAGGRNGLFIWSEEFQIVPGNVSKGNTHGGAQCAIFLTHAHQTTELLPRRKMPAVRAHVNGIALGSGLMFIPCESL